MLQRWGLAGAILLLAGQATAQDTLRIRMSEAMLAEGFDKHILPRFRFKHRIGLSPVGAGAEAELALVVAGAEGTRVFVTLEGEPVTLTVLSDAPDAVAAAATFEDWLTSSPGQAAVNGFEVNGQAVFTTEIVQEVVVAPVQLDGDVQQGSELALRHCGRCHVVDERNRMGGIGSTPSFAALRGRDNWSDLFLAYWTQNPHPSFTQVTGLTEPFNDQNPTHIWAVELSMQDIEAITAFVGTLEPLDLGPPIR